MSVRFGVGNNATLPNETRVETVQQADGSERQVVSAVLDQSATPIYDHANGTKNSVTTTATVLTPPAGCYLARISTDVDIFVNAAGSAAVDNGTSIRIIANMPEIIPVTAATAVNALSSSGTAVVRCTPLKARP